VPGESKRGDNRAPTPEGWATQPRAIAQRRLRLLLLTTSLAALATPMLPGMIRAIVHYQFHDPMVPARLFGDAALLHGTMGNVSAVLVAGFFLVIVLRRKQLGPADWLLLAGSTVCCFFMADMRRSSQLSLRRCWRGRCRVCRIAR